MFKIPELYRKINKLHAAIPRTAGNGFALPPLRVGCVLTHRCNLRCAMCFVWKRGVENAGKKELTTEEWLKIFRQIPGFSIITFTGGEPLVRKDIDMLLEGASRRHRLHLVTNGTLFNDDMVTQCINLAPTSLFDKGLLSIGVSLEGPPDVHDAMVNLTGAYDKTTRALGRLSEMKKQKGKKYPLLDLKIVICKETAGSLIDLYKLAETLELDIISYQQCSTQESSYGIDDAPADAMYHPPPPVTPIPSNHLTEELEELKRYAETGKVALRFNPDMSVEHFVLRYENRFPLNLFTCRAAWSVMHIGPYGTVYPCFSISMGNLREKSLMHIWNSKRYRSFRKKLKSVNLFPGCVGCCVMERK